MLVTILALVWIGGIAGAVDVIMHGRTAQGTTAWSLALLLLPPISLPFYMVFGERRFLGYARARRKGLRALDQSLREFLERLGPHAAVECRPEFRSLARLGKIPPTQGNRVGLLIDGNAMYEELFARIDRAERYVLLQFYIYRDDLTGRQLQERLLAARGRGVEVFLMYDEIGCVNTPGAYFDRLAQAGCHCSGFRTLSRKRRRFLRLNFRNHRKIAIVDGLFGLVGGINIGDEYRGRDLEVGPWRDSSVSLAGPSVQCLQMVWLEDWYWAQRRVPEALEWKPRASDSGSHVLVYPSGPADELETGSLLFGQLIGGARERLWIATPYFAPDEFVLHSMQLAALRGVDVRVLIPARCDSLLTGLASRSYFREMTESGIRIFLYEPGFLHQKVILSDQIAAIGTANLDNRSMRINFEVTAIVSDDPIVGEVERMLARDLGRSTQVTREQTQRISRWRRFAGRLARTASPIL